MKPGYTTTEFWLTLLTQLAAVVAVIHPGFNLTPYVQGASVVLAGAAQIVYSYQRSQLKKADAHGKHERPEIRTS